MTEPRLTWYFTFGFGQHHPRTSACLAQRYTMVNGTYDEARARVCAVFDDQWAFQYPNACAAGVDRYKLTYVPCTEYSPGELLPPTPTELARGQWSLEAYGCAGQYGQEYRQLMPYMPSIDELQYMFARYDIPRSARLELSGSGSASIIVRWAT